MKQYTRKQLKEYARLGLARDLTEVDPDTLPKWYEKIGVSRGIYGMNGGLIWDKEPGNMALFWPVLLICFGCFKGVQL